MFQFCQCVSELAGPQRVGGGVVGWFVVRLMHVHSERPPLTEMFWSPQLRPRSARSSRRRCSSAASSCPGRSPSSPTGSSRSTKSNTTRRWFEQFICVFISSWNALPSIPSLHIHFLQTLHFIFYLHAALSGIHKILQVPSLSHNCNNEWDAHKILIRL